MVGGWGSNWTTKKLDVFEKYVKAYLTIMETYKNKYNWQTLYFDGFAGSGGRNINNNTEATNNSLSLELFDIEYIETEEYKGAAERVSNLAKKFDHYLFVDSNAESLRKLQEKLSTCDIDHKLQFRTGDANEYIKALAEILKKDKKIKALVLLDPFGMQINWESIELLKDTYTDIWILIPSGVIVNRLLDREGNLEHINKLCKFFGMNENEVRDEFYVKKDSPSLFGNETIIQKKKEPIDKIANLYIKKLKRIWKYVMPEPLIMKNRKNVAIFHFVFASKNPTGFKIAKDIIRKVSI